MIAIQIVDETGKLLAEFDDPGAIRPVLKDASIEGTRCLAIIDPWGDTVFNRMQAMVLQAELLAWAANGRAERRRRLEALAEFVGRAGAEPHLYVKFVGD